MIKSRPEFDKLLRRVGSVFHVSERLPRQVFRGQFDNFRFAEFDWVMSADFWKSIQELPSGSCDESILIGVLDPDPVEYFFKEFGAFNFLEISKNAPSDEYWRAIGSAPASSPADAMLFNSEVVVWLPSSLRWAIWGQRDMGVCVMAQSKLCNGAGMPCGRDWIPVTDILDGLVGSRFRGGKVPTEVSVRLLSNYS